jgi:hypothetical protein
MPQYRESFIFVIETDEPAIFWTGHTDLLLPADDVLPDLTLVSGAGELINLPDLEGLLNGQAQRMEVTLSGIDDRTLAFAVDEADQVPGAAVYIGRVEFDEDWQIASPVVWEWTGEG